MAKRNLGISWMNGRLRAACMQGAVPVSTWECEQEIDSLEALAAVLPQAMEATGFRNGPVSLVIEHRQVIFTFQETPPGKLAVVRQVLDRQVNRQQFTTSEAAWSAVELPAGNSRKRFLVALLPLEFVQQLQTLFTGCGLTLRSIFTVAALLRRQLARLPVSAGDCSLLVVEVESAVSLLVGRGQHEVLFYRAVAGSGQLDRERTMQEINRTALFVQQQFQAAVNRLWLFGEAATRHLGDLSLRNGVAAEPSPTPMENCHFARLAAQEPVESAGNLISQEGPRRSRLQRNWSLAMAALLVFAIALTVLTEGKLYRQREHQLVARARQADTAMLRDEESELRHHLQREEQFLALVGTTNSPPVPELFIRQLAGELPSSFRITSLVMARGTNGWNVRLDGLTADSWLKLVSELKRLESSLAAGPFQVAVTDSTTRNLFTLATSASRRGDGQLRSLNEFFLEGVIP